MNKKILLTATAAIVVAANIHAADSVYNPTLKQVNMYGGEYTEGEIVASEADGALKFVFNGEPISDKNQKAIQVYCKVWDLKPGKYNMTVQLKTNGDTLRVPMNLSGSTAADPKNNTQIAKFVAPKIGAEWTTANLTLRVTEKMMHGYFIMRVGGIPKGSELYLKPEIRFTTE